jgi:hypothetical protein
MGAADTGRGGGVAGRLRRRHILLVFAQGPQNRTLSYQHGWPAQFARHPELDVSPLNLLDRRSRLVGRLALRRVDAVVLLHSVFSNELALRGPLLPTISRSSRPKALFLGNEYKLMPEKMRFAEQLGVSLLVSQILSPPVHELYRERLGCAVVGIPNVGFDPDVFMPRTPLAERDLELGYRAFDAPWYVGYRERAEIAEAFERAAPRLGLRLDVSLAPEDRFDERGWAAFLDRCRGQIGCEVGSDYFELTDETREKVNAYLGEHADATWEEVRSRFFDGYRGAVSGRTISGRHVEAAAAGSVQILLEGEYGGVLHPDVHYIPLRKDYSNLDETVERLRDDAAAGVIARAARELALERFTYRRLIDDFRAALEPFL